MFLRNFRLLILFPFLLISFFNNLYSQDSSYVSPCERAKSDKAIGTTISVVGVGVCLVGVVLKFNSLDNSNQGKSQASAIGGNLLVFVGGILGITGLILRNSADKGCQQYLNGGYSNFKGIRALDSDSLLLALNLTTLIKKE